ncbi:hypothetical protein GEMRC1_009923 [Eukaryota sp. GEM-RC1]
MTNVESPLNSSRSFGDNGPVVDFVEYNGPSSSISSSHIGSDASSHVFSSFISPSPSNHFFFQQSLLSTIHLRFLCRLLMPAIEWKIYSPHRPLLKLKQHNL